MPRVKIDTPGVTVELDASEVSIEALSAQALALYRAASRTDDALPTGPAGGIQAERRGSNTVGFGSRWSQPQPTQRLEMGDTEL
jgi:hypothetical protein